MEEDCYNKSCSRLTFLSIMKLQEMKSIESQQIKLHALDNYSFIIEYLRYTGRSLIGFFFLFWCLGIIYCRRIMAVLLLSIFSINCNIA